VLPGGACCEIIGKWEDFHSNDFLALIFKITSPNGDFYKFILKRGKSHIFKVSGLQYFNEKFERFSENPPK
jgi:hypothetical protein